MAFLSINNNLGATPKLLIKGQRNIAFCSSGGTYTHPHFVEVALLPTTHFVVNYLIILNSNETL